MKSRFLWVFVLAAFAVPSVFVSTAEARRQPPDQKRWSQLSLQERRSVVVSAIHRDRTTIAWWLSYRLRKPPPPFRHLLGLQPSVCASLGIPAPTRVCIRALELDHSMTVLKAINLKLHPPPPPMPAVCEGASMQACQWYFDGATQCEVSHEGWFDTDTNPTYKGRFQMDYSFETETPFGREMEARYGRANNWPPGAQIEHAFEVWSYSGWSRWPPYYHYGCSAYHGGSYHGVAPFVAPAPAL